MAYLLDANPTGGIDLLLSWQEMNMFGSARLGAAELDGTGVATDQASSSAYSGERRRRSCKTWWGRKVPGTVSVMSGLLDEIAGVPSLPRFFHMLH
jgi:hypothetical protein